MSATTIRLFLVDGTPTGVIAAEVGNWTGKLFAAPRTKLAELRKRVELQGAGVYLLIGQDPEAPGRSRIYIGESDRVGARIAQHDQDGDKDFYEKVIVLVSKDANLTKAHARYLERRLIAMARANGSAFLTNDAKGSAAIGLPEPDVADMQAYLTQAQLVLPVLGMTFTQPVPVPSVIAVAAIGGTALSIAHDDVSPVFTLAVPGGAIGRAQEVDGQFLILAGSTTRREGVSSWTAYKAVRDQLVADGKLVANPKDQNTYLAPNDIVTTSPSAAAAIVAASNMNGRQSWKSIDGTSYQAWFDAQQNTTVADGR